MRQFLVLLAAGAFFGVIAHAQDDPAPLGDVARQARAQKQQKDAPQDSVKAKASSTREAPTAAANSKDNPPSNPSHVITNDELPEHLAPATPASEKKADSAEPDAPGAPVEPDSRAAQWKSQIQQQKNSIAELQQQIDDLSKSIQYAPANCVENCRQWNDAQQKKQQQADAMKSQLEELKQHLEEMQEKARQQGFGSTVYDP
jgi:vancomycin resistance protein YoaR